MGNNSIFLLQRVGWARTIIQFFWLQCPCVTICQWASASSVCIWPPCIVVGCCDAQQIKYHWHYIGFGTNRQLRTSAGEVRYGNLHLCRTLCWSALLCWTQWSEHPMHLSRERADASPAVLIQYTLCYTGAPCVCVCLTHWNYVGLKTITVTISGPHLCGKHIYWGWYLGYAADAGVCVTERQ